FSSRCIFRCSLYLPDLHSFPTRRSSDLDSPRSLECGQVKSGIGSRARSRCRSWSLQTYAICLLTICAHHGPCSAVGKSDDPLKQLQGVAGSNPAVPMDEE